MRKIEPLVVELRKAGKSWNDVRKALDNEKLLDGNGSNLQLVKDLEDMDGKPLKKIPKDELYALFAEMMKHDPDVKPMEIRDRVWERGIRCYRQDISSFKACLTRNPLDSYLKPPETIQMGKEPDSFPITDFRILGEMIARHGKQKILRVLREAF
jgi:hypothetical protein